MILLKSEITIGIFLPVLQKLKGLQEHTINNGEPKKLENLHEMDKFLETQNLAKTES